MGLRVEATCEDQNFFFIRLDHRDLAYIVKSDVTLIAPAVLKASIGSRGFPTGIESGEVSRLHYRGGSPSQGRGDNEVKKFSRRDSLRNGVGGVGTEGRFEQS